MSRESIFNESSVVKNLKLEIDGQEIPRDDIQSCEMLYNMFSACISAVFVFRDSFNLKSSKLVNFVGNTKVKLQVTDYERKMWQNEFRVQDMKMNKAQRETYITLICIDEASHLLHKYVKANTSSQSAVDELASKLGEAGATGSLSANQKSVITTASGVTVEPWVIPGNLDYYSFFTAQLRKEFSYIYQTHYEYRIGKIDISKLKQMQYEYTNDGSYNRNLFKIHEYAMKEPSKILIPKLEVIRYLGKEQTKENVNIENVLGSIILNGNADAFKDVQDTNGNEMNATTDPLECQLYDLFEPLIKTNQLQMWTVGSFEYGDVGQKVKVKIGAETVFSDEHLKGNQTASGIYLVTSLSDYISGDKFIQKHVLSRFDNPKVV